MDSFNRDISILCISDTELPSFRLLDFVPYLTPYLKNVRLIVHLGDGISNFRQAFTDYSHEHPEFSKIIEEKEIIYLRGNHDKNVTRVLQKKKINIGNFKIFFYHGENFQPLIEHFDVLINKLRTKLGIPMNLGWYYRDQAKNLGEKYEVVVHGHTHRARIDKIEKTIYFCPGGFTDKSVKTGDHMSFGTISFNKLGNSIKFDIYTLNNFTENISFELTHSKKYGHS